MNVDALTASEALKNLRREAWAEHLQLARCVGIKGAPGDVSVVWTVTEVAAPMRSISGERAS
jgi:hypothetical protein